MVLASRYYGLVYGPRITSTSTAVIDGTTVGFNLRANSLALSSSGPAEHTVSATTTRVNLAALQLPLSSSGISDHELAASPTRVALRAWSQIMTSSGIDDHELAATAVIFGVRGLSLQLTSSGVGDHVLAGSPSRFTLTASALSLSSSGVDDHELSASPTRFDLRGVQLSLSSSGVDDHELSATPGGFNVRAYTLSLSTSGVSDHELSATTGRINLSASEHSLSSSGIDDHQITASPTGFNLVAVKHSLSTSGVSDHELSATTGGINLVASELGLSTSGIDDHELAATTSRLDLTASQLSLSSSGVADHELAATSCGFNLIAQPLALSSAPGSHNALCFVGTGWMFSDALIGGFARSKTYGYAAIWYQYRGGNPDEDGGFTYRGTVFQAHDATEAHLEQRIEVWAPGDYPDLTFEVNDDRGVYHYYTDLASDGGPRITDGDWHLLLWGNDPNGGWYFGVDGQLFAGRTGSNRSAWYSDVQDNTPGDFTEFDVAASRVQQTEGTQNIYGCLDQGIIVNDRTIGEALGDFQWLYNGGIYRPVSEIVNNPNIWPNTYVFYPFDANQIAFPGEDVKDLYGDGRYHLIGAGFQPIWRST